jgi:hypothetical protein
MFCPQCFSPIVVGEPRCRSCGAAIPQSAGAVQQMPMTATGTPSTNAQPRSDANGMSVAQPPAPPAYDPFAAPGLPAQLTTGYYSQPGYAGEDATSSGGDRLVGGLMVGGGIVLGVLLSSFGAHRGWGLTIWLVIAGDWRLLR